MMSVETHYGRRGVDRVHDVVERNRQGMNVFAVQRGDERPVQTVDDRPGPAVAGMLDVLDDIRLGHVRRIARDHLLQRTGADADLLGKANEVVEEVFFAGKQTETGHVTSIIEGS